MNEIESKFEKLDLIFEKAMLQFLNFSTLVYKITK